MTGEPPHLLVDPIEAVSQLRRRPVEQLTGVLVQRSGSVKLDVGAVVPVPGNPAGVLLSIQQQWAPDDDERSLVVQLDGAGGRLDCEVVACLPTTQLTVLVCRVYQARAVAPSFVQLSTRRSFDLADHAYLRARELVLLRQYPPGSTLDPEDLAFDLGADPPAATFALTRLELDGLVRRDPDRGYVVVPFDARSADETFDARCAIELGVLETALAEVDGARIAELRTSFEAMAGQLVDGRFVDFERYLDANVAFHQQIVMLSDNEALRIAYLRLGVKAVMTRSFGSTRSTSQRFIGIQRALLSSIEARDLGAAKEAAIAYRDLAKVRARSILDQTGGWL